MEKFYSILLLKIFDYSIICYYFLYLSSMIHYKHLQGDCNFRRRSANLTRKADFQNWRCRVLEENAAAAAFVADRRSVEVPSNAFEERCSNCI